MAKKLVTELAALFQGQKLETVQQAFKEAAKQVWPELVTSSLSELFDSQMETLKARGCPKSILEAFQNKKNEVLDKAAEMDIPEGNIPFVPVIPRSYMGIYGLMPMVRNGEKVGYTYLDPNEITNNEECPKGPYYIYDVEPGKATLGKSPEDVENIIKKQNRLCHVPEEDIAVCVHTDVLSDHYLWSAGSRYGRAGYVPSVYLSDDGPELDWGVFGSSLGRWGSASCRSRA